MSHRLALAVCVASLGFARLASAQTPPPEGPPVATPAPWQLSPPSSLTVSADDQRLIDRARGLVVGGRYTDARQLIDARFAQTNLSPYSALGVLRQLSVDLEARPAAAPDEDEEQNSDAPRARSSAEAFSMYSSLFLAGVGTGVYIDIVADFDEARSAVWTPILLGAAGLGGAYLLDRGHPIRAGRGYALSAGATLGLGAGIALSVYFDEARTFCGEVDPLTGFGYCDDGTALASTVWLTSLASMGLGYGLAVATNPRPSSVAFVNATGLYGGVMGLMTSAIARTDDEGFPLGFLVGEGLGAGLGALGATFLQPTASQNRWMNLGVLVGGLLGAGIAVLPTDTYDGPEVPLAIVQLGMIGGGIGGYLLGDRRGHTPPARGRAGAADRFAMTPGVSPVLGGASFGVNFPNLL